MAAFTIFATAFNHILSWLCHWNDPPNGGCRTTLSQHGFDPERRRHLALAFTLLRPERQPVAGIRELLVGVPVYGNKGYGGGVGALLPPAFSPGLADYFYYDPLALLPKTQFPVLDETGKAYEIRGLAPHSHCGASRCERRSRTHA